MMYLVKKPKLLCLFVVFVSLVGSGMFWQFLAMRFQLALENFIVPII